MHFFALVAHPTASAYEAFCRHAPDEAGFAALLPGRRFKVHRDEVGVHTSIYHAWEETVEMPAGNHIFRTHAGEVWLLDGWVAQGGRLLKLSELASDPSIIADENTIGEFSLVAVRPDGSIRFSRNKSGVLPLYVCEAKGSTFISNRAATASYLATGAAKFDLTNDFWSSLLGVGFPLTERTAFAGVQTISANCEASYHPKRGFSQGRFAFSRFENPRLREMYLSNETEFWDFAHNKLLQHLRLLVAQEYETSLFLSGGKDSRLLFALLAAAGALERTELVTTGPPYNSDVIVAKLIAEHFEKPLNSKDTISDSNDYFRLAYEHLHIGEGRTPPIYPRVWFSQNRNRISIVGHESGTREDPAPRGEETNTEYWHRVATSKLAGFDRLRCLKENVRADLQRAVLGDLTATVESTSHENVWLDFYATTRTRHYLAGGKLADRLSSGFAPYLLMTDFLMEVTHAVGQDARSKDKIHFELMKRSSPWLTYDCPFGQRPWSGALLAERAELGERFPEPVPYYSSPRAPVLGGQGALISSFPEIRDYILSRSDSILMDLVDRPTLEHEFRAVPAALKRECVYAILSFLIAEEANSLDAVLPTPTTLPLSIRVNSGETAPDAGEDRQLLERYGKGIQDILLNPARFSRHEGTLALAAYYEKVGEIERAHRTLAWAADRGDPQACFQFGRAIWSGAVSGIARECAADYFERAAETGHIGSTSMLGQIFLRGIGRPRDVRTAHKNLLIAAEAGDNWAVEFLADAELDLNGANDRVYGWYNHARAFYAREAISRGVDYSSLIARVDAKISHLSTTGADANVV